MLEGVRVLDLSRYLPGPFATLRLAEMGAEVIKIETKPSGDPARGLPPFLEDTGAVYVSCNHGKKSVALNLRQQEGIQIIRRLVEKADVLIESYRPGIMEKMGLGYEQVKEINPGIIYCSLSGYGQQGRMANMGGHDINYLALSGILQGLGEPGKVPVVPDMTIADLAGGMAAVEAILAAIIGRFKSGKGSYLDISLTDTLLSWQVVNLAIGQTNSRFSSLGEMLRQVVSYYIYETKDHRYMALGALEEKFWKNFCRAIGKEDWIAYHQAPARSGEPIFEEVKSLFLSQDYAYWSRLSLEMDACLTPVISTEEISEHVYVQDRRLMDTHSYEGQALTTIRTAARGVEGSQGKNIPLLGEHTKQVLLDWLETSEDQLDKWTREGII